MLELVDVRIAAAGRVLVNGLSARIGAGEVLAVMGPSGAGKSSLLDYLCGTLAPGLAGSGGVRIDGRAVESLATAQRHIGILFQDDLLFPHMTVLDNLLFALPAGPREQRVAAAAQALARADLAGFATRMPHTLSGGQRARVSVLRALLALPRALLLDEPFSRLDAPLRARFRAFVFDCLREARIPALLVTHDAADLPPGAQTAQLGSGDA